MLSFLWIILPYIYLQARARIFAEATSPEEVADFPTSAENPTLGMEALNLQQQEQSAPQQQQVLQQQQQQHLGRNEGKSKGKNGNNRKLGGAQGKAIMRNGADNRDPDFARGRDMRGPVPVPVMQAYPPLYGVVSGPPSGILFTEP